KLPCGLAVQRVQHKAGATDGIAVGVFGGEGGEVPGGFGVVAGKGGCFDWQSCAEDLVTQWNDASDVHARDRDRNLGSTGVKIVCGVHGCFLGFDRRSGCALNNTCVLVAIATEASSF